MEDQKEISHEGHIVQIENGVLYVQIISKAACSSCNAKAGCSTAEMEEKLIEVPAIKNQEYKLGDYVVVVLDQSQGVKAVLLGYFFPFLLILITLITSLSFTDNQGVAGLISLGMLVPYYAVLYLSRKRIKNNFTFRLQ